MLLSQPGSQGRPPAETGGRLLGLTADQSVKKPPRYSQVTFVWHAEPGDEQTARNPFLFSSTVIEGLERARGTAARRIGRKEFPLSHSPRGPPPCPLQSRARSRISLAPVFQLLREKKGTACSLGDAQTEAKSPRPDKQPAETLRCKSPTECRPLSPC